MKISDIPRAVTTEDLIRRYDLENLKTDRQTIKALSRTIENQYTIVKQFIQNTAIHTNQADSTVWFYNGVPTLLNEPYKSFSDASEHVNDLYYDRETGYVYQLQYDTTYSWVLIQDDALAQSLAIANSEADAQDNRRRIFYNEPTPPYDTGDIWVNEDLIMRCRCSRDGDSFKESEWVTQSNYSETCVLLDVRAVLNSFITNVTDNYVTNTRLETTKSTIEAEVTSKLDGVDDSSGNVTAASIVLAVNNSDSSVIVNANKINLTGYVTATDLAGTGTTTINGSNITTGDIKSSNYVANTSGTKLSLTDGTIDTKNFKVTSTGDVTCNNATINGTIQKTVQGQYYDEIVTIGNPNNTGNSIEVSSTSGFKTYINGGNVVTYNNNQITALLGYGYTLQCNDTNGNAIFKADGYTGNTEIKRVIAGNIDCGTCSLSTNADSTVYFNKTFASPPKVVLTSTENGTATPFVGHVIEVTTTYFKAFLATPGTVTNKGFMWIAVS